MRLSRRNLLLGGGAIGAATLAGRAFAQRPQAFGSNTVVLVEAHPIRRFSVAEPDRMRFGDLTFRSGLELRSTAKEFGGFSGLWRSPDGRRLVALADNAQWLRARIRMSEGKLAGLSETSLTPLALADGKLLRKSRFYDIESLAIAGNVAFVGVERNHAVMRFTFDGTTFSRGAPIGMPRDLVDLPRNSGLEALAVAPARSPLAGSLLAVSEQAAAGSDTPTKGYVLTGRSRGAFEVARSEGFDISDMGFVENGDLLLLERRFSLFGGFGTRVRRVPAGGVGPGRRLDGPIVFQSEASHEIDNMEGLAVHQQDGQTILTMVSDDNFNGIQRTLLLEFVLSGESEA